MGECDPVFAMIGRLFEDIKNIKLIVTTQDYSENNVWVKNLLLNELGKLQLHAEQSVYNIYKTTKGEIPNDNSN